MSPTALALLAALFAGESLRETHPNLVTVALDAELVANELISREDAESKLVAAELLESVGQDDAARKLWVDVARRAEAEDSRHDALHALGLHYFLRRRYADCWRYWGTFQSLDPESPWARGTARFAPFLELASQLRVATGGELTLPDLLPKAPDFRGAFGELGEKSAADLRGGWVLLDFWASSAPRSIQGSRALAATVERARKRGWEGTVLGVNLDTSREAFEKALASWTNDGSEGLLITWPQHHDGLGFESPIARAFAIPKVPLRIAIDPAGRVTYISRNGGRLAEALRAPSGETEAEE